MKSKAVALFLSLGLATTVAACSTGAQSGGQKEGEQTPPASTTQDGGEEGGAPTAPASTTPNPGAAGGTTQTPPGSTSPQGDGEN
ncbi:hypothetical protein J0895_03405, partial [Phormidium pseudopriestleyi FRX01]